MGRIGQEKGLDKEPDTLTGPEMEVVTVVFHQFETGLREGTIYTRVISLIIIIIIYYYCYYHYCYYYSEPLNNEYIGRIYQMSS